MHLNVFSVNVRTDAIDEVTAIFSDAMRALSTNVDGFYGMMGLIDDDAGEFLSIALNNRETEIFEARQSAVNQAEISRLRPYFVGEPSRAAYHVEVRYMPQNGSFPGEQAMFARATTGVMRPKDVQPTIERIRDSFVYSAIYQSGCVGFMLCSHLKSGTVFGFSLWSTLDDLLHSESDTGYYHQEMSKTESVLVKPVTRRTYRVFDRLFAS